MKKILIIILSICFITTLSACETSVESIDYDLVHLEKVLGELSIDSYVSSSFNLVTAYENVSVKYTSNNSAIVIEDSKAIVTRGSDDVLVTIQATAQRGQCVSTKNFNVNVMKNVINDVVNYVSIADVYDMDIGDTVLLESVSVSDSYSLGTHFTDGDDVIFVSGLSDLTIGDTYELKAEISSYGVDENAVYQLINVEETLLSDDTKVLEPKEKSIEYVATTTDFNYYSVCGTLEIVEETLFMVDGDYKLEISSNNLSSSIEVLKYYENREITINVYVTGGFDNREVLTYVTQEDIVTQESIKVNIVKDNLDIDTVLIRDVTLPTFGDYDTTITWESNNAAISNTGVISRQENDVTAILSAVISLNDYSITKEFEVTILSVNQRYLNELFISEYYEGTSSNKYIEIYNPTNEDIDLTDYTLKIGVNGALFSTTYNFTGVLNSGDVFIVYYSSSVDEIKEIINSSGMLNATSGVANFNGNDAIGLFKDDKLIDIFGIEGNNPTTSWPLVSGSTVDHRVIRDENYGANPVWDINEWVATSVSSTNLVLDSLCTHVILPMFKGDDE